jgi:two-component system, OmpR family, response regulator
MVKREASRIDQGLTEGGTHAVPLDGHVLICDDDAELRRLLASFLRSNGYRVTTVGDGREVSRQMQSAPVDLVILDIMLPGTNGLEICRDLRAGSMIPILMLTAKGDETDRIVGLEMGADDYMSKPFSPRELLARVRAMLRRSRRAGSSATTGTGGLFGFEGWTLEASRRELRNPDGVIIDLSTGEFDLLLAFLEAPQRILTREHLLDIARHRAPNGFDRSIDVQVSRLRRKIDASEDSESLIKTVRGAGYMFVPKVKRT